MATPRRRYRAWNLAIRSDIPLPGAMTEETDDGAVDLDIAYGSDLLLGPGASDGPYRLGREGFEFTMPDVARYRCAATGVVVDRAPGARREHVAAMLIATVIPAVIWMRGDVVLHAAAAVLPGAEHAIAVLGPSGSGKSALLARAAAAGARLIADDSIRLHDEAGGIRISGLPGGYFGPLTGDGGTRPFHPVLPDRQCASAMLGGIVLLDDRRPAGRLSGADAIAALLAHRHRPRIARLLGIEHRTLATLAKACGSAPIHRRAFCRQTDIAALLTVL